jgi:hypothetical protein
MRDMTKIIENIVTKEPNPDPKYAPHIVLQWYTKTEGQIYHDLSTGKRLTHDERDTFLKWENFSYNYLSYSTGASPRITYIKYHRRQNVMELAYVNIPMNRAKPGEIRTCEYNKNWSGNTERYFVDLSQYPRRLFWSDGAVAPIVIVKNILRDTGTHRKVQIYNELFPEDKITDKITSETFSWTKVEYVTKYLTYQRQLTIATSKTAKAALIAKGNSLLAAAPTTFPDNIMSVGIVRNFPGISIVEAKPRFGLITRFYYDGKTFAAAKSPKFDVSYACSNIQDVSIYNPEDLQNGMLNKYADLFVKPTLEPVSWDDRYRCTNPDPNNKFIQLQILMAMIRNPMYEQLAKSYKGIQLLNLTRGYTQDALFGPNLNKKATTVDKWLGLNKYQITRLISEQNFNDAYATRKRVAIFRKLAGENASSLDNHTSDIYIDNVDALESLTTNYLWDPELIPWATQIFRKIVKSTQVSHNIELLIDTICAWRSLNWPRPTLPNISISELQRLHDVYTAMSNEQFRQRQAMYAEETRKQEERRRKDNKPKLEFRQQLNYEDENYLIRLPVDGDEIQQEGLTLHHCVGGYVYNHESGATTIMFLRKKSEPDKPFYTIEVEIGVVDGKVAGLRIRQIHGFGNRYLGNDPEAIPTVVRWLRSNNIQCHEDILTSVSTQYSIGNKFIKMPEVV